ncbi:MAG TPA: hypothetical protein VD978_17050 [Azospirillum sp.]|nr:hypothetical protein [Azospirillum sp.]
MPDTSPNAHRPNNPLSDLADVEDRFAAVQKSADRFGRANESSRKRLDTLLYDALERTFEFVVSVLDSDLARLKAFVHQRTGERWSAWDNKNPFLPVVKLAFGDVRASSHSQYAKVLQHALAIKPAEQKLSAWLSKGGGIDQRYKEAVSNESPSPNENERAQARAERLQRGRANVARLRVSDPFKLTLPESLNDDFALALVQRDSHDMAHVVEVLDIKPKDLEAFFLRHAENADQSDEQVALPAVSSEELTSANNSMRSLIDGLATMAELLPPPEEQPDLQICLLNDHKVAGGELVLLALRPGMAVPFTLVATGASITDLPSNTEFAISHHALARFLSSLHDAETCILQKPHGSKAEYRIISLSSGGDELPITSVENVGAPAMASLRRLTETERHDLIIPASSLDDVSKLLQQYPWQMSADGGKSVNMLLQHTRADIELSGSNITATSPRSSEPLLIGKLTIPHERAFKGAVNLIHIVRLYDIFRSADEKVRAHIHIPDAHSIVITYSWQVRQLNVFKAVLVSAGRKDRKQRSGRRQQ